MDRETGLGDRAKMLLWNVFLAIGTGWHHACGLGGRGLSSPPPHLHIGIGLRPDASAPVFGGLLLTVRDGGSKLFSVLKTMFGAEPRAPDFSKLPLDAALRKLAEIEWGIAATNFHQAEAFGEATRELIQSKDERMLRMAAFADPRTAADALIVEALTDTGHAAERFRQAARYFAPSCPEKARDAYGKALARNPGDSCGWIELGRLNRERGDLADAAACFERAWEFAVLLHQQGALYGEFGELFLAAGEMEEARTHYDQSLGIAEQVAANEPDNLKRQRDLSLIHIRLGQLDRKCGNLAQARNHFERDLAIAHRFTAENPRNAGWQRDLSFSYVRLGQLEQVAGNLAQARAHFENALVIRMRLSADDPQNTEWQQSLSVIHARLGDFELTAGHQDQALFHFERDLAITQRIARHDPHNSGWQRDLAAAHSKLGELQQSAGQLPQARSHFRQMLAITERLAAGDPQNTRSQRDFAISVIQVGLFELAEGSTDAALKHFNRAEAILTPLIAQFPQDTALLRMFDYLQAELKKLT